MDVSRSYSPVKRFNVFFFRNQYTSAVPVVVLITGLTTRALLPTSLFDRLQSWPIFADSGVLNQLFANHGFALYTALYLLICFVRIMAHVTRSQPQSLLPSTAQTRHHFISRSRQVGYLLVDILVNYLITVCVLWLLLDFRGVVVHRKNTLNISGHFMVITTITVSLLAEVRCSISLNDMWEMDNDDQEWTRNTVVVFWIMASVLVITALFVVVWWCVLLITAVFYHTVKEKVLGLVFGYSSPLLVYYIKPLIVRYIMDT